MLYVGKKSGLTFFPCPSALIGQGAEGHVYRAGSQALKLYTKDLDSENAHKIETISLLSPRLTEFSCPTELVIEPTSKTPLGFAMKFEPGDTLQDLLDRRATKRWSSRRKITIARRIAAGVAAAHGMTGPKIILGDVLKSSNIIVNGDKATFVDVASVSLLQYRSRSGELINTVSTTTTPGYVAPERLKTSTLKPSQVDDEFALAVVLFELFFGRSPTEPKPCPAAVGADPDDFVRQGLFLRWVRHKDFEAPSYDHVTLPIQVDTLFRQAFLSASRPSAREWLEALTAWEQAIARRLVLTASLACAAAALGAFWMPQLSQVLESNGTFWLWTSDPVPTLKPGKPIGPLLFQEIYP